MYEKLVLKEFAGQKNDVEIIKRWDGSKFVRFEMAKGFGYPKLELNEMKELLNKMEAL